MDIFWMGRELFTEVGLIEPLACALQHAANQGLLPSSPATTFYDLYYKMVERTEPLGERALGVSGDLGQVVRELHSLWYIELRATEKEPGWGYRSYIRSDMLLVQAGRILLETKDREDMHNFARAYGR